MPEAADRELADARAARGGFRRHIAEAIRLNRQRMPRYARLTGGESVRISKKLIRLERLALPAAWWVDRRARRYQTRGVPIVHADFVEMDAVPAFRERAANEPSPAAAFRPPDARRVARRVRRAYRRGGFHAAAHALAAALDDTRAYPDYGCMLRHLLESALRIARLAPIHARRAEAAGIEPPTSLSRRMLALHLLVLPSAVRLDRLAAPIQADGIPIIRRDVPAIETDAAALERHCAALAATVPPGGEPDDRDDRDGHGDRDGSGDGDAGGDHRDRGPRRAAP